MRTIILLLICFTSALAVRSNLNNNFLAIKSHPQFNILLQKTNGTPLGRSIAALIELKFTLGEVEDDEQVLNAKMDPKNRNWSVLFKAFDKVDSYLEGKLKELEMEKKAKKALYDG